MKPFIPRMPGNKLFFRTWIEDCFETFNAKLKWDEACGILKTRCEFGFEQTDQATILRH